MAKGNTVSRSSFAGTASGTSQAALGYLSAEPNIVVLEWILIFLLIAAAPSVLGLPKLAGASASVAQLLVFIVLAVMLVYLVVGMFAVA